MWYRNNIFFIKKIVVGEYVYATRFQNMVKEMILNVFAYNTFRKMIKIRQKII